MAWIFVDGFPSEFKEEKKKEKSGAGPAEGVDPTGTWQLEFTVQDEGVKGAELALSMEKDGNVKGTIAVDNPMGGARIKADVEGNVSGDELEVEFTLSFGEFKIDTTLTATVKGDALDGKSSFQAPGSSEPSTQSFSGKRAPK